MQGAALLEAQEHLECHLSHLSLVPQVCHWHQVDLEVPFLLVLQGFLGFHLFLEFRSALVGPEGLVGLGHASTRA